MSAEPSLPSGSPPPIHWIDRPGRFVDIGGLRAILTEDLAILLDALMERPGMAKSHAYLIDCLYEHRNRPEPEWPEMCVRTKICGLRKLGLIISNVFGMGYRLDGVREILFEERAGA